MCLLYTRAHPENGHEASSQFLFHLSAFMHSVTLGKSPGFSTFLCPLCVEQTQPQVAAGEFLLCTCLEQCRHTVCGQ